LQKVVTDKVDRHIQVIKSRGCFDGIVELSMVSITSWDLDSISNLMRKMKEYG
jgi:hypothetical protein